MSTKRTAPAQAWKHIYAEGADIPVARRLFQRIQERYVDQPVRSPVRQWIIADDEWVFIAATNCGWMRLELEAWTLGHPGTRRYIESTYYWGDEEREDVLGISQPS